MAHDDIAREILRARSYVVLATADADRGVRLRLYRASVHHYWILDPDSPFDVRVGVSP